MRKFLGFVFGLFLIQSCTEDEIAFLPDDNLSDDVVEVRFNMDVSDLVKSSIAPDEYSVKNINVYAFRNGLLVDQVYSLTVDGIVMTLPANSTYNIYAVANIGAYKADVSEDDFLNSISYSIRNVSMLSASGCMPMRGANKMVRLSGRSHIVDLSMERLAAKVKLSIDKSALLQGLRVSSVRLCQSASVVYPFKWEGQGGSRVLSEDETIDGDYATVADLNSLNDGNEVYFYTLENCQGILLPHNEDPWLKVPQMIRGKEGLCSYLEIGCEFDGSGLLEGEVCYRIYLGLDACTSFDVPGNACIGISLMLTGDGLKTVTWKAEADVDVRDGYVTGVVRQGLHSMSDLYVGEILLYEVFLSDALNEFLGDDLSTCTLRLIKDGQHVPGLVSEFAVSEGHLYAELRCIDVADGSLYLCDPYGKCVGCLEDDVQIKLPRMMFSEYPYWTYDEALESLAYIPECEINGESSQVYLYLVDDQGYNLNGSGSYGFDDSLFDFNGHGVCSEDVVLKSVEADIVSMTEKTGNPAACINVSCINTGGSHDENVLLAGVYASEQEARLTVHENNFAISSWFRFGLKIQPVTLTLVDNGWAGYHTCQLSMVVDNSSNLPLDVTVCQLIATNTAYGAVDSDYVQNNLRIDRIEYMTGEFYNDEPPFYGSIASFYSERNEEGDQAMSDGDGLVYPLEGIYTEDIIQAINYDRRGAGQMIHMVDVAIAGYALDMSEVILEDRVSDGSTTFDYIYYSEDSWNYRGADLFSVDMGLACEADWAYEYPNVTPRRLERLADRWDGGESIGVGLKYVSSQGKTSVSTVDGQGAQYGLTLGFEYTGSVHGYVLTYPKGTWFSAQDNRCQVDFSFCTGGILLKNSTLWTWADDGGLKSAMDQIYGHAYKDSDRPMGGDSYMHSAHPTDMDLVVSLRVEGDSGVELFPFEIIWEEDHLDYYHAQDAKTYECTLNSVTGAYTFAMVRRK